MKILESHTFFSVKEMNDAEVLRQENNFIDLYFRYLAACRDYPYAQHDPPPWPAVWKFHTHAVVMKNQIVQEFRRSNPGFEL